MEYHLSRLKYCFVLKFPQLFLIKIRQEMLNFYEMFDFEMLIQSYVIWNL